MTDSPDCSQRRAARSRIWAAGSFGDAAKSNPSRVASVSNRAGADPAVQGGGFPAGDLVLAQDLQEVQVAEFPGAGLGEAGVEGVQHAGQFQVAQRGGQRAAVGDGHCGGHDAASVMAVKMRAWWPAICPSALIQPRVGPGRMSRAAWPPAAAASSVTAAVRLAGPAR